MTAPTPPPADPVADAFRAEMAALEASARRVAFLQAAALLRRMAEDAERFAAGPMAKLDDLPKAQAYREAARRVADLE